MEFPASILIDVGKTTLVVLMGFSGFVGLLALISPRMLAAVSSYGNKKLVGGIETGLDKRSFDIDRFVHSHARPFGVLVMGTVGYLWYISRHGPESYSKSSMLIIVAVALIMGVVALAQLMWQTRTIESHSTEANTDPLTSLSNRRVFDVELSRRLAQRQREGTPLCLMIIDIDDFKTVNDDFGHAMGDAALKKIAGVLSATAREADIVARLGGDEFAVILPGSSLEESCGTAERLRKAIAGGPVRHDGSEHALTVSIGVSEADIDDDTSSLLKRADSALYAAKKAGRNCSYRQGVPEPTVPAPC
ncbi:MAG: GGDEF domain-containing protein [Planctomycetaceae bacterium]